MRLWQVSLLGWLALSATAVGQRISFGVIAGTNITNHFLPFSSSYPGDPFNPPSLFQYESGPPSFLLGGVVEARFTDSLSLDINVIHRPMKSTIRYTEYSRFGTGVSTYDQTAVRAWQFPVLLKYRLPVSWFSGAVRPFLEAGPSFRTQEDAAGAEPSRFGVSAGAGVAWQWHHLRLAPSLRYTRWQREHIYPRFPTKPDQVEFLTSVTYDAQLDRRHTGDRRFLLGVLGGYPITRGFARGRLWARAPERPRYVVGLTTELRIARGFAVEVDGLYKPLRAGRDGSDPTRFSVLTWQIPVLAKYRLRPSTWTPFVEAGPSFRLSGNLNGYRPSHAGFTAGGGVETRLRGLRLAPMLRYTRWAGDSTGGASGRTNLNAVELLVGLSF